MIVHRRRKLENKEVESSKRNEADGEAGVTRCSRPEPVCGAGRGILMMPVGREIIQSQYCTN